MDEDAEQQRAAPEKAAVEYAPPLTGLHVDSAAPLKSNADVQLCLAASAALKSLANFQLGLANSPALKSLANFQLGLAASPALKSIADVQLGLASSPALKSVASGIADSPALRSITDFQLGLADSPALKSFANGISGSPALKSFANGISGSPALKSFANGISGSPALKSFAAGIAGSPALKSLAKVQLRITNSPALKSLAKLQLGIADSAALRTTARVLSERYAGAFEAAVRYYDEHWGELETEHPDHPQPVLFVVGSLGMAVGMPLYEAAKLRRDDSELLNVLEPVLSAPGFIAAIQAAVQVAPHLNPIQRRHLTTALGWLGERQYVDAYPPFYQGLEAGFFRVARANGVIDDRNRFLTKKGKANKVDDVFDQIIGNPRFRRFLTGWVFGDRGNPFRHGDVDDPGECRRQALRLAVALIGWLELFGGWEACDFEHRLQLAASEQRAQLRA